MRSKTERRRGSYYDLSCRFIGTLTSAVQNTSRHLARSRLNGAYGASDRIVQRHERAPLGTSILWRICGNSTQHKDPDHEIHLLHAGFSPYRSRAKERLTVPKISSLVPHSHLPPGPFDIDYGHSIHRDSRQNDDDDKPMALHALQTQLNIHASVGIAPMISKGRTEIGAELTLICPDGMILLPIRVIRTLSGIGPGLTFGACDIVKYKCLFSEY
ncbi:uncharacterized protein ARMOST_11351 [Armillaria ostoyae]|uniref:Uncharacterized protein n=1 Tax=Armillaria ostoyae TaxID=47428 RepID=A0A284RGX2_ARMOS|nr:uncharacterized protein ARMOST_11351 [Armillaria ostoyae]